MPKNTLTGQSTIELRLVKLDLSPLEAEIILQALEPIVLAHRDE